MSKPTPTACLLANTLISWRGFWRLGVLNTAKEKIESNDVRSLRQQLSLSAVSPIVEPATEPDRKGDRNDNGSNVYQGIDSRPIS